MQYFKQLDALRFYAAFQVIILHMHFTYSDELIYKLLLGVQGVPLFFILSGFLITGILLDRKEKGTALKDELRIFYIRRSLRIFPVYYLVLLFVFFAVPSYRNESFYDFLYISNFRYAFLGHFTSSPVAHFWSLAVEEQFYLVWPLIILLAANKKTFGVLISIFSIVVVINLILYISGYDFFSARTFACVCFLSAGGILAYLNRYRRNLFELAGKLFLPLVVAYCSLVFYEFYVGEVNGTFKFYFFLLFSSVLVARFALGFKHTAVKFLAEHPVVLYLGKISYGLYVYHLLVIFPVAFVKQLLNIQMIGTIDTEAFVKILVTIACAAMSWTFFEKPINKLKDKFPYSLNDRKQVRIKEAI